MMLGLGLQHNQHKHRHFVGYLEISRRLTTCVETPRFLSSFIINTTSNISEIFHINLNKRADRKEQIEEELKNHGVIDSSECFDAIKTKGFGILGCTRSRLATDKYCLSKTTSISSSSRESWRNN